MALTNTDLLNDIRRSGVFPSTATTVMSDTDLLAQATKELREYILPRIQRIREEYYITEKSITTTASLAQYRIPHRAAGNSLRDVLYIESGMTRNLSRIESERVAEIATTSNGSPAFFYLEAGRIVLYPTPGTAATLKLKYMTRPGKLVTNGVAPFLQCTAIATQSATLTRLTFTSHGLSSGTKVDLINSNSPYEYRVVAATIQAVATNTIDLLTTDLPADWSATDDIGVWLATEDNSPVAQLPEELWGALAQRTVYRINMAAGHMEMAGKAKEDADEMVDNAVRVLTPRVEGEPRVVTGGPMWRNKMGPFGLY